MRSGQMSVSTVYTFAMPYYVFVQIRGTEKPAQIQAEKAEMQGTVGGTDYRLTITSKGETVGQFDGNQVVGWWVQET